MALELPLRLPLLPPPPLPSLPPLLSTGALCDASDAILAALRKWRQGRLQEGRLQEGRLQEGRLQEGRPKLALAIGLATAARAQHSKLFLSCSSMKIHLFDNSNLIHQILAACYSQAEHYASA